MKYQCFSPIECFFPVTLRLGCTLILGPVKRFFGGVKYRRMPREINASGLQHGIINILLCTNRTFFNSFSGNWTLLRSLDVFGISRELLSTNILKWSNLSSRQFLGEGKASRMAGIASQKKGRHNYPERRENSNGC
jgi:hypothetical protein